MSDETNVASNQSPAQARRPGSVLRVLMLVGRDPRHPRAGGGDVQAWAWATWLAAAGHHVEFVSQSDRSLPATESMSGVRISRLGRGPLLATRAWRKYRKQSFDLVYEDPIGAGRTPYLSPLWTSLPIIAVWHQVSGVLFKDLHSPPVAAGLSFIEKLIARAYRLCFFWAPSEEVAEEVVSELGFDQRRVMAIYPTSEGIDCPARDSARERSQLLVLGLLRSYKSAHHAIQAMPTIIDRIPKARLTIAGRRSDEVYRDRLITMCESLGVRNNVDFALDISEADKSELLSITDLLILPSRLEGYGIVTIEANSAGIPVVASSGVPRAAVQDGINGIRYEFGDVGLLADAVIRCLTDDDLYSTLSEGSRTRAAWRTPAAMGPRFEILMSRTLKEWSLSKKGRSSARPRRTLGA